MQMYSRDEWGGGEPLDRLIQGRWGIFNPDLVESGKAASLLTHIMAAVWDDDDGEPPIEANKLYVVREAPDLIERWRYFVTSSREGLETEFAFPDISGGDLHRYALRLPAGTILYRARPGFEALSGGKKRPWSGDGILGANTGRPELTEVRHES